jgi:hypothetical protein
MNEELEGLVSFGIQRGRDFNHIANVLAEVGYSKEQIATAQKIYSQKKKSQTEPTPGSKPQTGSTESQLAGPRLSQSPSASGTEDLDGKPYSALTSQAGALGALQYATTGVAPVSNKRKKEIVADISNLSSDLAAQERASAQLFLAKKEQGIEPSSDSEFIAAKQRENDLKIQKGSLGAELFPEAADALVVQSPDGNYQETELFKAKYEPVAIATLPAIVDDFEREKIAAEKARLKAENKADYYDILTFGNIPVLSQIGDSALYLTSTGIGIVADAVDFVTRFGAQTEGEYEGILGETIGIINDSAKSWSFAMRENRGFTSDNFYKSFGVSERSYDKDIIELFAEGNWREGIPSLALMVADALAFSYMAGSVAGIGSISTGVVGAELEAAILTGSSANTGFGLAARQVASNLQRNVAESPVMFGAIATSSAQSSWDAVKDDENLTLTEKVALSTLSTFANTLTEGLNVDDLRLAAGSLNLDGAAREEALKSFSGTFKTYLKDMVQVGVPESFEEGLNYYTEALGNYIVKGEMPTATEPMQAMLIGFLAPSLNVTAVYSKPMLEVALKNTVMMLPSTKRFIAEQELAKKRADIVEALADENIAESEKKVLQNALDDVDVAIAEEKKKDYEFYSSFEYADANEIVNVSGQIKAKAQQWKKSRSKETRAILEAEIRELYNQKLEIEKKYDSQAQAGVPSGVQKGAAPKQGEPVKSRGEETLETSGVLQTPEVEKAETTPQEEEARKSASKDASETFEVAGVVPGKVISQELATTLNKVFQSVRTVVKGGKVKLHYTQESIANANAQTRATKAKNPNVFFDGFFDKSTNEFHVYIPTGGDVARVVKVNENTYAVVDPKNGQTVKTFKDSQTAFRYKDAYDKAYIEYAVGKARHEAIHPVIDVLIEDTVDANGNVVPSPHRTFLYDSIIELYEANPAVKDLFDNFIDAYVKTGADKKTIEREVITEFLARMADEKTFKSLDKGFIQKVKDFVNEMLVRAGVKGITISTDDDLYRVARAFKMSMNLGKELRIAEGKGRNYTPVGDPFKVDILERLPKSNITQKKLESVISKGKFGILTTENPRGTRFPEEVNKRRQEAGKKWLEDRGYSPIEVVGKFEGIAENSLFVPNLTVLDANDFALEFSQEGIAHSSAFINNDGSYSPRNLESNQFNIDYNKTSNDYFSTIKLSDGTLSSFKMDYRWDIKMNQRAVFDGLTNPLDFAIQLKDDEQTFAQFFDSVGDSTMRDQAVLLQLLAEKFGFDKNIVFSSDNNNPIGIYEDSLIVNLSTLQSAKDSFGTFATAISLFISKENMGLYQSMLNEILRENSDEFKAALEEAKGYEFAFDTSTYEKDSFDAYAKGMAAKQVLESRIAEYFTTAKTDSEEIKQMWDNTQSMLGKAFNVEFKDLYPAMKIDQVMGMMASPTINPIGGAFIKELFENQVKYGGEKELGFDVLSSLDPRVSTLFTSPSIDVIRPVFVNDEFISFFEDAIDGLNSDDNYLSKMADYIKNQRAENNKLGMSRYRWLQAYDALEAANNKFNNLKISIDSNFKYLLTEFILDGYKNRNASVMNAGVETLVGRIDEFIVDGYLGESILDVILSNELEKTSRNIFNVLIDKFFTPLNINVSDFEDFIQTLKPEVTSASILLRADSSTSSTLEGIIDDFNEFEQYYNEFEEYTRGIENHKYALLIPNFNDKFKIQSIASNQGFKDLLDIEETVIKPQQADNRTLSSLQQAFNAADMNGYNADEKQEFLAAHLSSFIEDRSLYGLRIPSPSGRAYFLVTDKVSGMGISISNTRIMESGKYRMVGQAIVAEASPLINWLEGNKKVKKISTKTGEKLTGRNITIAIPKLNDTYVVSGSLQDNRVNVAFQSTTTGYDLKDPGAALSVMPKVIEAVSQLFPEANVRFITFSALGATTDKRSGNELRTGTYQFTAKRLFRDFYMEANNSYGDQVIAIPTAFTGSMMQSNAFYDAMINKQNKEPDISFAIRTVESIPVEVSESNNGIKNAINFAVQSAFPNKLEFKDALQERFKEDAKRIKEKYGVVDFEKFDENLKNYLVDAYLNETLIAINSYPDALGWYDYKTRAAMEIMSLIHPELKTDADAQATFKIAVAVTSNGNKVFDNFKEANRQYEYFKNNGKFDSSKSIGTQSSGIKSTFKLTNDILSKMSMAEFTEFLTSKFRAGDLKYLDKKGKKVALLSGFNVDTIVYGASIFGPKIGNGFFMNLYGQFDQLTMDRWFMRQYGRLTGTLIKRDNAKIKSGAQRLAAAKSALTASDKKILSGIIPGYGKMNAAELATKINRASINKEKRDMLSSTATLNEVRLAGNSLEKLQTGEIEAPGGGNQRSFIIDVFNEVQKRMKNELGIDITIADLQAVNWYPEKALYQTFQVGRTEETGAEETSENEQPDYESAAKKLAIESGITENQINDATGRIQQSASATQRDRAIELGRRSGRSIEEVTNAVLGVKGGVDFAIREINWVVSPEGKGDPAISSRSAQMEEAVDDLANGRITNEEFRELSRLLSPVTPITKFFEPATEERMKSALKSSQIGLINTPVKEGTEVALRLDIPAYLNGNTWVVSIHDGSKREGLVISYRNVARIENVQFKSKPKSALAIALGAPKSTIGRMFGAFKEFEGSTPAQKAETAKKMVAEAVTDPAWVQVGMNPTRASWFYNRKTGIPIIGADEVIQIGGLVYAKNPKYTSFDDAMFVVDGLRDAAGKPVYFAMSLGGPKIEIDGKKVRQFAERMADSNIQLYSDIINNPENYYTPQKLEEIQDRLTVMTIPELLDEMTSDRVLSLSSEVKVDLFDEDNVSVLIGAELIKRYTAEGNDAKLLETIERMAKMGTTVGRMLRHFGEIKNTTHAGIASAVVAMAARAGRTLNEVQLKRLNDLALALFNKQVEAKNLMLDAIHSPSKANDEAIKKTEKELSIATKQLDDFISTVIPKKYSDLFGAIMQGNLLTPISQVFNIWGNVANTFTRQFLVNPPAALIDAVRAFASGKDREVKPSIGAFLFGLKRAAFMGVPESFRYMFTGRKPSDELFEYEYRRGFIPLQAMVAALSDTRVANAINKAAGREVIAPNQLARLENGEVSVSDRVKKFTEATFGIPAEVMFRTLTLGDRPFSRFAEGIEIYRQAKKLGLQGDAFANFLKHPDPSTIKRAKAAGKEITYQADTSFSKGVQTILGALSKTELGAFIVRIIVPFSKTPSNIIYDTLNYVAPPVALARALKAGKKKDYKEFSTLLAKSVIGFSVYAVADFLISLGIVSAGIGDDEKKEKEMKYSLFPYDSINLSALRRIMDGGTAELQDGDVFINYSKAGPIGAIIGARASYWAGKGLKPTSVEAVSDEYGEMFTQYLSDMLGTTMSSFQFMAQQSFLANTNQILELLTSKGEIKPDYVLTSLFKTTSAVVLPNTLTALNRSIRTKLPDLYDKNSLYNSLLNVIKDRTFNTDGVAVKVNIFGERIDQTPAGADPILYNLFDPMKYQAKEYEPYQQEVYRLYEELGQETGAIPTIPSALNSRKFTDKETNEQYYFTNEEVNNMLESLGKERQVLMKDLINQDWYKEYTDEDKLTEFEYIYKTTSKDGAWKEMYDKYVEKAKQEKRLAK